MRWRSSLAAALLAIVATAGVAVADTSAPAPGPRSAICKSNGKGSDGTRPCGRHRRPRFGIASRVAVERPPRRQPALSERRAVEPGTTMPTAGVGPSPSPTPSPGPSPPPPPTEPCTQTVSGLAAAKAAISSAAAGAVVCLANGSYGKLELSASKPATVTLRAENPGLATLAGATLSGSHLRIARFDITDEVSVEPGSTAMTVAYNRITGGGEGIDAGPTTTTTVDDTKIIGNQLIGPFGEDAIHLNRYHDGDGDGVGILIEGNEITGVRENGNHSDCLQTVWVGDHIVFRKNYLHDNRCQGFFVKDQADLEGGVTGPVVGIAVEDNLFLRDEEPCASTAPGCGEPAYFQVFGPYSGLVMRRNTIWGGEPVASFQEGTGADTAIEANVVYRFWTSTDLSAIAYSDNTVCEREASGGSWPSQIVGETVDCAPAFNDPSHDDYRLLSSNRGVDWAPAEQHYGP